MEDKTKEEVEAVVEEVVPSKPVVSPEAPMVDDVVEPTLEADKAPEEVQSESEVI